MSTNGDTRNKHAPNDSFSISQPEDLPASKAQSEGFEMTPKRHITSQSRLEAPAGKRQSSHKASEQTNGIPSVFLQPVSGSRDPEAAVARSENVPTSSQHLFARTPPTTPILLPEYRYCHRDGVIKPFRAHHCRACGTVCLSILLMCNLSH